MLERHGELIKENDAVKKRLEEQRTEKQVNRIKH
jgi:hypothetical protein